MMRGRPGGGSILITFSLTGGGGDVGRFPYADAYPAGTGWCSWTSILGESLSGDDYEVNPILNLGSSAFDRLTNPLCCLPLTESGI
jgi:hypothetical protein